jgi:hypothetical protein
MSIHECVSVCLPTCQRCFHWTNFCEIWYWRLWLEFFQIKICWKLDKSIGYITYRPEYTLFLQRYWITVTALCLNEMVSVSLSACLHISAQTHRFLWHLNWELLWKSVEKFKFVISNFRHVLNVVFFLLGNSLASEFYMPTFRNTLSVPSS